MNQIGKKVKGEYLMRNDKAFPQRIKVELQGDYIVVSDDVQGNQLLTCTPNKPHDDFRGVHHRGIYRIKISIEAVN